MPEIAPVQRRYVGQNRGGICFPNWDARTIGFRFRGACMPRVPTGRIAMSRCAPSVVPGAQPALDHRTNNVPMHLRIGMPAQGGCAAYATQPVQAEPPLVSGKPEPHIYSPVRRPLSNFSFSQCRPGGLFQSPHPPVVLAPVYSSLRFCRFIFLHSNSSSH